MLLQTFGGKADHKTWGIAMSGNTSKSFLKYSLYFLWPKPNVDVYLQIREKDWNYYPCISSRCCSLLLKSRFTLFCFWICWKSSFEVLQQRKEKNKVLTVTHLNVDILDTYLPQMGIIYSLNYSCMRTHRTHLFLFTSLLYYRSFD